MPFSKNTLWAVGLIVGYLLLYFMVTGFGHRTGM